MCARPSAVDKPLALPVHVHSPLLMTRHSPAMRPRRNCHLTAPEGKVSLVIIVVAEHAGWVPGSGSRGKGAGGER
eukprot:scaffold297_cov108-Isochrysis_galbana.AAC.20